MDSRCIYQFLKQTEPLMKVTNSEGATVLKQELLSPEVERLIPPTTTTLWELCSFLKERFGDLREIKETWIGELESAASARMGGTR